MSANSTEFEMRLHKLSEELEHMMAAPVQLDGGDSPACVSHCNDFANTVGNKVILVKSQRDLISNLGNSQQ